jgi:hypothetical protein
MSGRRTVTIEQLVNEARAEGLDVEESKRISEEQALRNLREAFPDAEVENVQSNDGQPWYLPASELVVQAPGSPPWLVERLLLEGVDFVSAEPKSGKTWVTTEIAVAIASGTPAFGRFEIPDPGPVLYVAEEDSAQAVSWRISALCRGRGIAVPSALLMAVGKHVQLDDPEWQARLERMMDVRAFVFDPLVRMHSGNEDRAESMRPVTQFLRRLAYDVATPIVNHHWNKPNQDRGNVRSGNRMRGTGDFYALFDSALYLSRSRGSVDVAVETEHRNALEEPAWSFALPTEDSPEEIRLEWTPGGVESIKARAKADEVLRAVQQAEDGLCARELRERVPGEGQTIDAAAHWLMEQGHLDKSEERRPDKRGALRSQTVWRLS